VIGIISLKLKGLKANVDNAPTNPRNIYDTKGDL
tara:strand:+ start:79 stop:180 length:102 start_codon:yes stop_codon:yes gene_type:complete